MRPYLYKLNENKRINIFQAVCQILRDRRMIEEMSRSHFQKLIRNRLISDGLEPDLSHTKKSRVTQNFGNFPRILKSNSNQGLI